MPAKTPPPSASPAVSADKSAPASAADILAKLPYKTEVHLGEVVVTCALSQVSEVLSTLKAESFTQLSDMTAVDYPNAKPRFQLVYQLLSVSLNQRLRVISHVADGEIAPSVTALFPSASWAEREVWDMFGIFFDGHGDLRRLLTDYGFEGHPLRKDFPLTGTVEVRYDVGEGRVVYEPVNLSQEYRDFDFVSPWQGMQTAMRNPPTAIAGDKPTAVTEADKANKGGKKA